MYLSDLDGVFSVLLEKGIASIWVQKVPFGAWLVSIEPSDKVPQWCEKRGAYNENESMDHRSDWTEPHLE